jgi:hypothetical protein
MNETAKAAMLAALNAGRAVDVYGRDLLRQWGIVSLTDDEVRFEPCRSETGAYDILEEHYSTTPAHVVSRLGGWTVEV